jgi:tetratricopeptide (TPR) repeat protein
MSRCASWVGKRGWLWLALWVPAAIARAEPAGGPDPDASPSAVTPARLSPLGAAQQALASGRYAEAEAGFTALLAGKTRGEGLLGLARVELETGRYDEAAESAAKASSQHALASRAETLRGEAFYARGKLDAAQHAFETAARDRNALRAQVLLGRLLQERGKPSDAEPHFLTLVEAYNNDALGEDPASTLCYVAMAARALGSMHDANDAFREAAEKDHARTETQLEWASLFFDKYDPKHAGESVDEALSHNPNSPLAHLLKARFLFSRAFDFPAAEEQLRLALAVNPNLVGAYVMRAAFALREMDIASADHQLDLALAINPNQLEALSVRGAARFLADDHAGLEQAKREVWKRNPRFSRFYSIVAEYAEWEHRYDELVEMARDALKVDPEDALAYATLGFNLLRQGDERAGLEALHEAWKRDHFNAQVFNTLNLYEHVIEQEYVSFAAAPFELRVAREERAALEPYLVPMLRRAYADMQKRYAFTPEGPLKVELYADAQHFSVRTTGLPNVGVQGVCFGKVVTAISPRGGPFNWGQIIWHELSHIFHLQLSKNHVPRWFTEGLAEYETTIARPEWKREEDRELWVALLHDRVPKLHDMNKAFTQARSPSDLMTAYYAASQAVAYIVERFGFPKVRPMLEAWGRGERSEDVFVHQLGIDLDRLDADFRAYLKQRLHKYDSQFYVDFGRYVELEPLKAAAERAPDDPDAQAAYALGLLEQNDFDAAEQAALQALRHAPHHPLAHFALTRVALEKHDARRAQRCLRGVIAGGQDGYILRVLLARAALAQGQYQEARAQAERAIALDADQAEAFRVLLDLAEKQDDDALALRALAALAGLDQHDRLLHLAWMSVLHKQKAYAELVVAGERALYIDPEQPSIHRMLGEAYLETGKPAPALAELDRALAFGHKQPGKVELDRARALLALGRKPEARRAADAAVKADPKLKPETDALFAPSAGVRPLAPRK